MIGPHQAHPVRQPLLVVVGSGAFDSLDREVGRKGPSNEVGDGLSETKHVEEDQDDGTASKRSEREPKLYGERE